MFLHNLAQNSLNSLFLKPNCKFFYQVTKFRPNNGIHVFARFLKLAKMYRKSILIRVLVRVEKLPLTRHVYEAFQTPSRSRKHALIISNKLLPKGYCYNYLTLCFFEITLQSISASSITISMFILTIKFLRMVLFIRLCYSSGEKCGE